MKTGKIWAIARNTFLSAIRMKLAIVFIVLLMILLPLLSITCTGDGTIKGRIQSFMSYGFGLMEFLLILLTIIISCYSLSSEVKAKQLFMVVTKPLRRYEIILGKILGVMVLNGLLLLVFSSVIYALTIQMPRISDADTAEITKLNDEFYTARQALDMQFDKEKIEQEAIEAYNELSQSGNLDQSRSKASVMDELRTAEYFKRHSAGPGGMVVWEFENVRPKDPNETIYVRFKYDASRTPVDRNIYGVWYIGDYRQVKYGNGRLKRPIYPVPIKKVVRTAHEISVPADAVADDGYLAVVFYNDPVNRTTVIFPTEDGLEVLYKAGTFSGNFSRGTLMLLAQLLFFTVLGVSLSAWLSFPVAILCSLTVYAVGMTNTFVVDSFDYMGKNVILFYDFTIKPLIWLLPKLDGDFNISQYMIAGRLISLEFLSASAGVLAIKGLVLVLAAMIIFRRREIAKIAV